MNQIQFILVFLWAGIGLLVAVIGFFAVAMRHRSFNETVWLFPWGIFVWGDAPVIGLFWFMVGLVTALMRDWPLFGTMFCLFWVVRALGETIYWLNQQFSGINRNPPARLMGYRWYGNDSVWFLYQIVWQMLTVVALVGTIYFANLWLR